MKRSFPRGAPNVMLLAANIVFLMVLTSGFLSAATLNVTLAWDDNPEPAVTQI